MATAEPVWVAENIVYAVHRRQVAEHGGDADVRDTGLLSSALARPRNQWAHATPKPDLASLAAAYAFGIARNHPFVDGNKRTAYVVCRTFLRLNGRDVDATGKEKYLAFLQLADGRLTEEELADWIRSRLHEARGEK